MTDKTEPLNTNDLRMLASNILGSPNVRATLRAAADELDAERAARLKAEAELKEMRPEVLAFAKLMEDALRRKDSERRGNSWQRQTLADEILPHLQERVERVEECLRRAKRAMHHEYMEDIELQRAAEEAVHAANFAMMIADIAQPFQDCPPRSCCGEVNQHFRNHPRP